MKIGLKLWSTNDYYVPAIHDLLEKKIFDYIELFIVPGSFAEYVSVWKDFPVPFILHAPHSAQGLNFSLHTSQDLNRKHCEEVQNYIGSLFPKYVIFHPGSQGSSDETIRQITLFRKDFPDVFKIALIENKPKIGLNNENCVGASPMEIDRIMKEANVGFCLDFGHASCYAAAAEIDYYEVLRNFLAFSPTVFHLSDGRSNSIYDGHLHFGSGDHDLRKIISLISKKIDSCITLETEKSSKENLDDFVEDVNFVKRLLNETN
jgi:sugar phosphate isomerase/epimerase